MKYGKPKQNNIRDSWSYFISKEKEFESENEIRFILDTMQVKEMWGKEEGHKVQADPTCLIQRVRLSPATSSREVESLRKLVAIVLGTDLPFEINRATYLDQSKE